MSITLFCVKNYLTIWIMLSKTKLWRKYRKLLENGKIHFQNLTPKIKDCDITKRKNHLFTEPEDCPIATKEVSTLGGKNLILQDKNVTMTHIPLKKSLKHLLEIDRLFNALTEYMEFLMNDKTAMTNFIQGQLWQKQITEFDKNGIPVPLFGYFNDVETGNSLGSHAKYNEVGSVYATIPYLPPNFASKLDSIILSDIFYSNDRKAYVTLLSLSGLSKKLMIYEKME